MKNRKNVLQKLHDETQDHEEQALPNSDGDGSLFLDSLLLAHIKNPSYTLDEARKDADFMMFAVSQPLAFIQHFTRVPSLVNAKRIQSSPHHSMRYALLRAAYKDFFSL